MQRRLDSPSAGRLGSGAECIEKLSAIRAEKKSTGTVARRDVTVEKAVREQLANLPPEIRSPVTVQLVRDHGGGSSPGWAR